MEKLSPEAPFVENEPRHCFFANEGVVMSDGHRWERLIRMMEAEVDVLDEFSQTTTALRQALESRNWAETETAMMRLNRFATRMESLESKRDALMAKLSTKEGFSARLTELSPERKKRFHEARSKLKVQLACVHSRTQGLTKYAQTRSRVGRELMEAAIPSTRGKTYNQKGFSVAGGRDPLILSRHL